jgi:SAM-dependent methyltransferase
MEQADKVDYIKRYEERLKKYGYSPETLGWGKEGRQSIRYQVLAEYAVKNHSSSVLDVGCGFADLYPYLKSNGWKGSYTGIDIIPSLLKIARENHPGIEVQEADICSWSNKDKYDYVIASGIFNAKLATTDNQQHILQSLKAMFEKTDKVMSVDFMSTYVDFQKEQAWHTDPQWLIPHLRNLTKRFIIRYDYMPYEFSVILFKDDRIATNNTFEKFKIN